MPLHHIPLYYRYVDDILIAIPHEKIEETLTVFNSLHERVKFTVETNDNNQVNFLNLKITLENNTKLIFDLYTKPTSSSRYLNYCGGLNLRPSQLITRTAARRQYTARHNSRANFAQGEILKRPTAATIQYPLS